MGGILKREVCITTKIPPRVSDDMNDSDWIITNINQISNFKKILNNGEDFGIKITYLEQERWKIGFCVNTTSNKLEQIYKDAQEEIEYNSKLCESMNVRNSLQF